MALATSESPCVVVGLVFLSFAHSACDHFDFIPLWFLDSGLDVLLSGATTLLARRYGAVTVVRGASVFAGGLALGAVFSLMIRSLR